MKRHNYILLFLSISTLCIIWITLLSRTPDASRSVITIPFWSFAGQKHWQKFLMNAFLFVPLGVFSYIEFKKKRFRCLYVLSFTIVFSALIETVQFISFLGTWDIDDIISNTLGGSIGLVGVCALEKVRHCAKRTSDDDLVIKAVSLVLIMAELIACFAFKPAQVPLTRQFNFQVDQAQLSDDEIQIQGVCYLYTRSTPKYSLILGEQQMNMAVEGKWFNAACQKVDCKAEIKVQFSGYEQMHTGVYLKIDDTGIKVEYLPGEIPQIQGVPDTAILKAYNQEFDTLVYQFRNRLIWLVGRDIDNTTVLMFQLYTDQPGKLPFNRKQYGFDNRGFRMNSSNEICQIQHYKVFEREIPSEFHVIHVVVGFSNNGKAIWSQSFRVYENFINDNA